MLSWFRRTNKPADVRRKPIEQLSNLLREHGSTILENKGILCLTTPVLISLNEQFRQLNLGQNPNENSNSDFQVILKDDIDKDIALVFDFVQKSPNLKLESGPVCFPSPQLCLLPFKSLQVLEIKRVPIAYLRGLHHIAKHLKILTCHRSASAIKDVIYQFGKDFNGILTLPELKTLDLSYNTINTLDQSLMHLPWLQSLDLCYNCLIDASSEFIPPIKLLNLGFNSIINVPKYSQIVSRSITTLVLCNNSLTTLKGLESFSNLQTLDVSSNCIVSFEDLLPLARLQFLSVLALRGNPVEFMPKYRLEVISRLSPIIRVEPISLDGQFLTESEMLSLGLFVQPPSLLSFIPKKPIGRTTERHAKLVDSVSMLSERNPIGFSTPNNIHKRPPSRRKGKVREAAIYDRAAASSVAEPQNDNESLSKSLIERSKSFGSRRNSIDDSILWIHKTNSGELIGVSKSLSDIDYATQSEPEKSRNKTAQEINSTDDIERDNEPHDSIYHQSSTKFDIDSSSISSGSSVSVVTDDDESPVYLVESVIGGDKNETEDKESVFVILKHPYLIEKDPVSGQVVKLDLNYLYEVAPFPNGVLRVSLRFDLIRADRRKRLYLFEDIDHVKEFNEFVSHLKPVALRNRQIRESTLEKYQCLKCSARFQKAKTETSFALCPNCNSSMVIQQYSDEETRTETSIKTEDKSSIQDNNLLAPRSGLQSDSHNLPRGGSSFEVLSHVGDSNLNDVTSSVNDSQNQLLEKNDDMADSRISPSVLVSETNHTSAQSYPVSIKEDAGEIQIQGNNLRNNILDTDEEKDSVDEGSQSTEGTVENSSNASNLKNKISNIVDFKSYLKNKVTGSQVSVNSTEDRIGINGSEVNSITTPSTSFESRNGQLKEEKQRNGTRVPDLSSNCYITNKDDVDRCDHRLKLYFTMDLFMDDSEDFRCMIQCEYARFDKADVSDCLLFASTHNIYLFRLKSKQSDSPKKWLHLIIKYGFSELKYIDYCFHNQSFRLEFEREYGAFKFIVRDSERCQKYVSLLLKAIQDGLTDKHDFPIVQEDPNPRTLLNIRTQIFGLKEDLFSMAKHIYLQATVYTVPPLLKSKKIRIRTHQQCVTGKELVSWLVSRREAKSRFDAISLCQKFVNHGLLYHISKELQFQDGDPIYKFCFSENSKRHSHPTLHQISIESNESKSSHASLESIEVSHDICLYLLADVRMSIEESALKCQGIFLTKTHLFIVTESHQWPLARTYQPPSFLKEQFNVVGKQRVIDLVKMTFFEDSPCHVLLDFVDELCDETSKETNWLVLMETVREMNKLTNALTTIWESEIKVDLTTDIWPSVHLAF